MTILRDLTTSFDTSIPYYCVSSSFRKNLQKHHGLLTKKDILAIQILSLFALCAASVPLVIQAYTDSRVKTNRSSGWDDPSSRKPQRLLKGSAFENKWNIPTFRCDEGLALLQWLRPEMSGLVRLIFKTPRGLFPHKLHRNNGKILYLSLNWAWGANLY